VSHADTIAVRVVAVEQVTPQIKHFKLAAVDGSRLPAFSGGSHIIVVMRDVERVYRNPYSLLGIPGELETYEIAVRRMEQSRGGSQFMHDTVQVGSTLEIAHPVNLFGLSKIGRKHILIAGGVGITPILAQMEDLHQDSVPYEIHYSVRSPEHAAFLARLGNRAAERLNVYYDSSGDAIDFDGLLSTQPLGTHFYVCGPAGMNRARRGEGARVGLAGEPHPLGAVQRAPRRRGVRSAPGESQSRCACGPRPEPPRMYRGCRRGGSVSVPWRRLRFL